MAKKQIKSLIDDWLEDDLEQEDLEQDDDQGDELVRMIRPEHYGQPFTADVHPTMIEDYRLGGYRLASEVEVEG